MDQMKGRVKALGEIALRVEDLEAMQRFYQEVIGLHLLKRFDHNSICQRLDVHPNFLLIVLPELLYPFKVVNSSHFC